MRVLWTARIGRIGPAASVGHHDPLLHAASMLRRLAAAVSAATSLAAIPFYKPPEMPSRFNPCRALFSFREARLSEADTPFVNCPAPGAGQTHGMAEYKIIPDGLHGFGVEVASIGRFLSVRGFPTEKAAQAWIEEQQHAEALVAHAATLPAAPGTR